MGDYWERYSKNQAELFVFPIEVLNWYWQNRKKWSWELRSSSFEGRRKKNILLWLHYQDHLHFSENSPWCHVLPRDEWTSCPSFLQLCQQKQLVFQKSGLKWCFLLFLDGHERTFQTAYSWLSQWIKIRSKIWITPEEDRSETLWGFIGTIWISEQSAYFEYKMVW